MVPLVPRYVFPGMGRSKCKGGREQHATRRRDCLHLDDADMQGVSHGTREMSLNHGRSGADHQQTTSKVVYRSLLWIC